MQTFSAKVTWERAGAAFADHRYSRAHAWHFDGGLEVPASSSPLSVPVPMSDPAALDPEEALVASVSSCHMLFFLSFAAKGGFVVDQYRDAAEGIMDKNAAGKMAMVRFILRPAVAFGGERAPTAAERGALHHAAHEHCYIANSLLADVIIEEPV